MKSNSRTALLLAEANLVSQPRLRDPTDRILAVLRLVQIRKALGTAVLVASLGACEFSLGTVQPYPGATKSQMSLDIAVCKDFAFKQAGTPDRQAGAFLMGLTIVGAPVAFEIDKATQREAFAACMASAGYGVTPPAGSAR